MSTQRQHHLPTSSQTLPSELSRYISLTHSPTRLPYFPSPSHCPVSFALANYTNCEARRVTTTITSTITPPLVTATKRVFVTVTKTVTCCPFNKPPPSHQQLVPRPHHNKRFRPRNENFNNGANIVVREPAWDDAKDVGLPSIFPPILKIPFPLHCVDPIYAFAELMSILCYC